MDHLMGDEVVYFLHIPKTAGTSFQYYLAQYFPGGKICPAQVQAELLQIPAHELQEYRLFAGHFWGLQQLLDQRLALITMLREPLARAISN
ncbi:sulfotransferase family 2 domain-containing protein [Nitrosococcus halophilus]|uniref:sulfotransferase family 2 domain-containing protein n=1 Tax=Nitrosococcus halophilus TaxID=133539 RepID=UPI00059E786E|nr:sulfotransferase family 2 domain-containing protein [Nitrosococcus halophilus]